MKSIEEIKIELTLLVLSGEILYKGIRNLPVNNELRTFVCNISPYAAYRYAYFVDKSPHYETRKASYKDPKWKEEYIKYIEGFGEE